MQDVSAELTEELAESIDSWRHSVPSRMEREDPFLDDGFIARPSTRVVKRPMRRPSTRLAFIRAAIPVFHRRPATPSDGLLQGPLIERPETALGTRDDDGDEAAGAKNPRRRGGLLGLFSRKRKQRSPSPSPQVVLNVPLTIHFLFVGDKSAGQTSLLFRARYGQFPDSRAIARTCYETYDTSGAPDLNTVERLSYVQWDAIFLCFDIQQKPTMHTILQWWLEAVQGGFLAKQQTEVLLHLVGLKKDARDKCTDPRHRVPCPFDSDDFVPYPTCCVIPSDAAWHARRIRAHRYLECSAMTGEGVDGMLEDAARESTKRAIDMARFMQMAHPNKRRMF
ncbi:P-loop containing nucleoside triphosphate hydrolase protein [Trichoderma asperelloides]|nr:P-loop containing nucleoside triphosphate hydrolase protein [Trichoderma asperelloides]